MSFSASFAQEKNLVDNIYHIRDSVLIPTKSGIDISATIIQALPVVLFYTTYHQGEGDRFFAKSSADRGYVEILAYARGIIYEHDGQFFVYEAVQPVKLTPLKDWINRGENGHYVIKRLENTNEVLTKSVLTKMKETGEQFKGKPYDIYFEWSDDKVYCSELVWKIYKQAAGIEIGQLERLSDFDLTHEIVSAKMKERYGNKIPTDEEVISPATMFNSDKLVTVKEK